MTGIPKRHLGSTGFEVTSLAYGAMELRGAPKGRDLSESEVEKLLNGVLDAGINLIDTSIDYGPSEERIGRYLSSRRDKFYLASKCGCEVGHVDHGGAGRGVGPHDYRRENLIAGVEQSLRRLRTDHLDLLQVHLSPSVEVMEAEGVVQTLEDLRAQGKTRAIGMSGTLPHLDDHIDLGVFEAFQIPYSIVQQEHEEQIARAATAGAGVIVRGGAGRGVPSGADRSRQRNPDLADVWQAAGLDELAGGVAPMELTIRFTLSHPGMTTNIVGTTNLDHLDANAAATRRGPLDPELVAEIKQRVAATTMGDVDSGVST